jgi:hypothetical protein
MEMEEKGLLALIFNRPISQLKQQLRCAQTSLNECARTAYFLQVSQPISQDQQIVQKLSDHAI